MESIIGRLNSSKVELGFESKVICAGRALQQFEFDIAAECGEEMISLCPDSLSWRFLQRGILLQGLVIRLNVPSFLID